VFAQHGQQIFLGQETQFYNKSSQWSMLLGLQFDHAVELLAR
jgi:hypothetical protein